MPVPAPLPRLLASRYVQPLREGGSLPAVVGTEDDGLWVAKFRGAGQGVKVLVAEVVVGLLARAAGLPVPDLAVIDLSPGFGRGERDQEIQDLLRKSEGPNIGLRYLDGAFNFDPAAAGDLVDPALAARVVWLDSFVTNPDRTYRNPNLLVCNREPWLIDHGAALYAHHDWAGTDAARARSRFPLVRQHVLLARSVPIARVDASMRASLAPATIASVMDLVPDELLAGPHASGDFSSAGEARERYRWYLTARLDAADEWVAEADAAREMVLREPPKRIHARR